ncbi:MAG: aspartate aminotransferase family protein [Limisphaerales bacterium]
MNSATTLNLLRRFESRNVTFLAPDGSWPIVWKSARGCHVVDADNRRYLDLTAAFGVAAAGHANPAVVRAGQSQMERLLHAMGDVHPHELKARLARELSRRTFERWSGRPPASTHGKVLFTNSGFEAVEAALKTARLATGKPGIVAFENAYHGLGYGALNATHRSHFRGPFLDQLRDFGRFAPFPARSRGRDRQSLDSLESSLRQLLRRHPIGAVLAEPIQARAGIVIPPDGFLPLLRGVCDEHGALLILDEIYTGFGRTGSWFACEHSGVRPDLVCVGKALTGGFPLSACVGRADVMDAAWPASDGEAIHTSTFLGHPVGCAMALAQIRQIHARRLPERAARMGRVLAEGLLRAARAYPRRCGRARSRSIGLMGGVELQDRDGSPAGPSALRVVQRLLARGFVFLPEGNHGEVISLTPPLTIPERELSRALEALGKEISLC